MTQHKKTHDTSIGIGISVSIKHVSWKTFSEINDAYVALLLANKEK